MRVEVLKLVVLPESGADPSSVAPSKKFTLPAGVPADEPTVAVSATDWPNVDGFGEAAKVVVVGAGLTTCNRTAEVDVAKLVVPR